MRDLGAGGTPGPAGLVLVRHAPTDWNRRSRYHSRSDVALAADAGPALRPVVAALSGRVFQRVLVSPTTRTRQTARLLAEQLDGLATLPPGPPQEAPDLREADFGAFEGGTRADLAAGPLASAFDAWFRPSAGLPAAPGGESWQSVADRARRVLDDAAEAGGLTLAISHGYLIKVLVVTAVPGVPAAAVRDAHLPNGGLVELVEAGGGWRRSGGSGGWPPA